MMEVQIVVALIGGLVTIAVAVLNKINSNGKKQNEKINEIKNKLSKHKLLVEEAREVKENIFDQLVLSAVDEHLGENICKEELGELRTQAEEKKHAYFERKNELNKITAELLEAV